MSRVDLLLLVGSVGFAAAAVIYMIRTKPKDPASHLYASGGVVSLVELGHSAVLPPIPTGGVIAAPAGYTCAGCK